VKAPPPEPIGFVAQEPRTAGLFAVWALSAVLLLAMPTAAAWQCDAARVVRVHDGDTLTVRCGEGKPVKLRLADIDAPELHQAGGKAARDALVRLVERRGLRVESRAIDRYQRVVASVEIEAGDVGLLLVGKGHAWCGSRPKARCRAVEKAARIAKRGLWAQPDPQPPWQWRREHPRTD